MQIKKDIWLSLALVVLAAWLFIAAKTTANPVEPVKAPCVLPKKCCQNGIPLKTASPWNFFTEGILHLTV
ncbi:MAG: hypothetical protein ABJA37_05900 [Ferruginibacter sp.]